MLWCTTHKREHSRCKTEGGILLPCQPIESATMEPILQFFNYKHLPQHLQEVSKQFSELAHWVCCNTPRCQERTVALRKLLEAKDAAVRAEIYNFQFEVPKDEKKEI